MSQTPKILRFAQDFGSGLAPSTTLGVTPANRLKLSCQRTLKMSLRQLRVAVMVDGHATTCPNQMSIVA